MNFIASSPDRHPNTVRNIAWLAPKRISGCYFIFLVCFVVLLQSLAASATTYYVDAGGGNDNADGRSAASAWKTIARVNASSLLPGDCVLFERGGIWREQMNIPSSGSSGSPITFGAYGTATALPIITGAEIAHGWTAQTNNIWKAAWPSQPNVVGFNGAIGNRKTSLAGLASSKDWCWIAGTLYVCSATNPESTFTNPGVEAAVRIYCVYSYKKDYIVYQDLHLKFGNRSCFRADDEDDDLRFLRVTCYGAGDIAGFEFDKTRNVILDSCSVDYVRGTANGDGYMFKGDCANVTLNNCKASYNQRRGAQFDTGIDGYIRITGGEYHHQSGLNQSDGISIDANDNILIEGVSCHDNGINNDSADGIQISGSSKSPIVRYCFISNNYNGGIILESDGGSIYYNISRNNRHGIAVCGNSSLPLKIYNNTCYDNEYGLFFYELTPVAPVSVKNNNFYASTDNTWAAFLASGLGHGSITMDYNNFWGDNDRDLISWNGKRYSRAQFSLYRADTGKDANSICQNPLFIDTAADDFSLRAQSPCISKGTPLSLVRDFSGSPVSLSGRPSIGAMEFTNSSVPPIDKTPPAVTAIVAGDTNPTSATTIRFIITFSEPVTGVDSADFSLATSGVSGASIAGVSNSGNIYTLTVNTGTKDGSIAACLIDNDSIKDAAENVLGGVGSGNGSFTRGSVYTIDKMPPSTKVGGQGTPATASGKFTYIPFSASDSCSGIRAVRLSYRKDRSGGFMQYGGDHTISPVAFNASLTGGQGVYEFYTIGVDKVGNKELPPSGADITLDLRSSASPAWRFYN